MIKKQTLAYSLLLLLAIAGLLPASHAAEFVGSESCKGCHADEYQAWQESHHARAMAHADEKSVLGDFNNVRFSNAGKVNRFFKKGPQFWVNIQGPDGQFHDYQIKYTFGYTPLQQYMVEFDDGRVQLIPFAWDSREKEQGGQRWFNLYPDFTDNHQDFFWTNTGQNWNYMCADCHSTDVKKNFDVKSSSYKTSYSEINVACEACHGPASEHLQWNNNPLTPYWKKGFARDMQKPVQNWVVKEGFNTLKPEHITSTDQVLVCAQCHSRRTQISDDNHIASRDFGDRYMQSLITNENYYADGQIYDEVFVFGSFLQSKMHDNGVACTNCHDPHSSQLKMPVETVCLQCHSPETYDQPSHHHHESGSNGSLCVNCHMPETTYMQIDDRRDHGWHKPKPKMAAQFDTPDTCLSCHEDEDSNWSLSHTQQWYGENNKEHEPFAPVFAVADGGYQNMASQLSKIAQSNNYADIIRASALTRMAAIPDANTLIAIARNVKHSDSNIRRGAIAGAANINPPEKWRILSPLLKDKVLAVRSEAAFALVPLWQQLSDTQKKLLIPALNEYMTIQEFNADRGYAHVNKATVFAYQNKFEKAVAAYQQSMRIEPYFAPAYINMADFYRAQGDNDKAIAILQKGIKAKPDDSSIPYSLGLAYIRVKETAKAQQYFQQAAQQAKTNAQYFYVYALALDTDKPLLAEKAMAKAYDISADPRQLYALCEMQIKHGSSDVQQCINKLQQVAPAEAVLSLRQLMNKGR